MYKKLIIMLLALNFLFLSCSNNDVVSGDNDTSAPADITDLAVVGVTTESLELSWTAPGDDNDNGTATAYDLRYSTSVIVNEATWANATQVAAEPTPSAAGGIDSFNVTGLSSNIKYYFAIKTVDEAGNWSGLSNSAFGTTEPDVTPPAQITDLQVLDSSSFGVTMTWTATGDDGSTGTASRYDIKFSTAEITGMNWYAATSCSGIPVPSAPGQADSIRVTGLSAGTHYYLAIRCEDEQHNWSDVSPNVEVTTKVVMAVSDLTVVDSTRDAITLSWTAPGSASEGPYTQYDIRYSIDNIDAANWNQATKCNSEPTPGSAGAAESFMITGLRYDTTHYFAIKSADSAGNWSAISNIAVGKTKWSRFAYPKNYRTGYGPSALVAADFNGDSLMDVAVANKVDNNISIFKNGFLGFIGVFGTGTTFPVKREPSAICAANFDTDADIDLAVTNSYDSNNYITVLRNNGNGSFSDSASFQVGYKPMSIVTADIDGDSFMDLAVTCLLSDSISILYNNGNGTFAVPAENYAVGDAPYGIAAGDLDNDGDSDLVVTNYSDDNVSVLLYDGDSSAFMSAVNYTAGTGPTSVYLAYFDNDAYLDLVVTNTLSNNLYVLLNNGDGSFAAGVTYNTDENPRSVFATDLNDDGFNDLAVANINADSIAVYLGNGDGSFQSTVNYWAGEGPVSIIASFVDDDIYPDLIVANSQSRDFSVLKNMTATR